MFKAARAGLERLSWSRHLYVRVYVALLISLAVVAVIFVSFWRWYPGLQQSQNNQFLESATEYAAEVLPSASESTEDLQLALSHRRWRRFNGVAVYSPGGTPLAAVGARMPAPDQSLGASQRGGRPAIFQIRLPDGRWLVAQRQPQPNYRPRLNAPLWLALIALAMGIAAWPVARRMTRRLEHLQHSVDALGEGQLSTRVAIAGNDEVARLAASFNRSAERIEALVGAQKTLLANASHELRSPLTRIRMAVELMESQPTPAMRSEMVRNIAELDQLVDEILLASRLDGAGDSVQTNENVDLTALLAEECARVDAQLNAPRVEVRGNSKLLRRMVRNLLENAQRHGDDSAVEVAVEQEGALLRLDVCDGGRGVPPAEREKIFTPFYRLPGARERDGGVGLGLSLVRQIARAHGGDVVCLAREGRGSCFRVTLPV